VTFAEAWEAAAPWQVEGAASAAEGDEESGARAGSAAPWLGP
jgi:hypothetical protein